MLDLKVRVFNINPEAGHELLERCSIIRVYSEFLEIMLDNDTLFSSIFEIRPYEYVLAGSRVKRKKQVDSITYYSINPIINNSLR